MNPIFSAVVTSCLLIMFTSFLSTKIDKTVKWNWFLVFMPVFLIQSFYLIDTIVLITKKRLAIQSLLALGSCTVLIFLFEILLCVKLEYWPELQLTFVFIPIWLLFLITIFYLLTRLAK